MPVRGRLAWLASTVLATTLPQQHARALAFLRRHQPEHDRALVSDGRLEEGVALALAARGASPWAADVPWEVFVNDVLPYACCDEPRCHWRPLLHARCMPLVAGCASAAEAALALNARLWDELDVRYEPNLSPRILSPSEVVANGRASCTGLSLLLVAACRSVGVPARLAGVRSWAGEGEGGEGEHEGNHAWVEVYDRGAWYSLGAAEPSPLGATWFASRLHAAGGPRVLATTYAPAAAAERRAAWGVPGGPEASPAVDVTAAYRGG